MPSILNYRSYDPYLELPNSHAHRKYEIVVFPSGLQCLLISDGASHMVAASMTVGCGSFNDPDDIPGLAHLCEHLIVSGGPQARLRQVVSSSGGAMNAYTGSDQTSFAFEISSYVKDEGTGDDFILGSLLEVFSSYFSKLKFPTASISAEIRAVHEEQMLNTSNMEKKLWHGLRLLSSKTHPFCRFATGNMSTLSRAPKALKSNFARYHTQNFVPDNMALVIKGPQSINHLKKVAVNSFSFGETIASSENHKRPFPESIHGDVFDYSNANMLFIKSEESPRIRLCYPMRQCNETVPYSVQALLCNMIGNESVDSLCYHLQKTSQLAEKVIVHTHEICKGSRVLFIDIEATNQGMKRVSLMLNTVFSFLEDVLMDVSDIDMGSILKEYTLVQEIQFKQQKTPTSSLEEIVSYSEHLQKHRTEPEKIVKGVDHADEISENPNKVKHFIKRFLSRDRLLLQIVDASFTGGYQFTDSIPESAKDEFFGFEYVKMKYDFFTLALATVPDMEVSRPIGALGSKIHSLLESRPTTLAIKHRDLKATKQVPALWCSEDNVQIWSHKKDNNEDTEVSAHIKFSEVSADAETLVGIEILASIMGEKLQCMLYNLETLGCTWGLYVNVNGEPSLMMTSGGPSELASHVLSVMFSELLACLGSVEKCSYQEMKRARVLLRRTYEEYVRSSGVKLVFVMASMLFDEGLVSPENRIKALELIDTETVARLGKQMLASQTYTTVLVSGDTEETLSDVKETCKMASYSPSKSPHHPVSSYLVPSGKCYTLEVDGPPGDPLTVAYYYIQMGERSDLRNFTMAKIVESVLSSYAFDDLRMKRNLAYGIFTGMRMFKKTFGIHITVPTGQHNCDFLVEQVEKFLVSLDKIVANLSEPQFEKIVTELMESAEEPEGDEATSNIFYNLQPIKGSSGQVDDSEHKIHWNNVEQMLNGTYNFGGKACEERLDMEVLENTTLERFRRFYSAKMSVGSPHRAAVIICKKAEGMPRPQKVQLIGKVLLEKLREAGLEMSEESLHQELEKCQDLDTLKDLNLDHQFSGLIQGMRYRKFKMKLKVGGLLKKLGTKQVRESRPGGASRDTFRTLQDIQGLCKLVN